mgnify:CR=1 FL=1
MTEEKQQESTAVVQKTKPTAIQTHDGRGLNLETLEDMFRFSQYVLASGLAPKGDTVEAILIKIEMGAELGIAAMQAVQNIAVINGRPGLWGDAVPGLVRGSGKQEWYKQEKIGKVGADDYGYRITSKRKGDPNPIETTFTIADAKKAGLWGKTGPWTFYPDRMLLNRARAFNARDNFPDVLKGLHTVEEIQDVAFEVVDSKPLEDGDKTARLAEKLTAKVSEPPAQVSAEVTAQVEEVPPPAEEPAKPKRGRPSKQSIDEPAQSEPVADWKETLKAAMYVKDDGADGYTEADFADARKALDIRKLYVSQFTQDEAKAVLEWLRNQKGE